MFRFLFCLFQVYQENVMLFMAFPEVHYQCRAMAIKSHVYTHKRDRECSVVPLSGFRLPNYFNGKAFRPTFASVCSSGYMYCILGHKNCMDMHTNIVI